MSLNPLSSRLSGLRPRLVPGLLLSMTQASSAALPRESLLRNVQCVLFPFLSAASPSYSPGSTSGCPVSPGSPSPAAESTQVFFSVIVTDRSRQIRASFFVEEIVYLATCHPLSLCILWLCSPLWPLLTPLPVVLLWLEVWGDLPYAVTEQPMD